jgi:hypothetical protein
MVRKIGERRGEQRGENKERFAIVAKLFKRSFEINQIADILQ